MKNTKNSIPILLKKGTIIGLVFGLCLIIGSTSISNAQSLSSELYASNLYLPNHNWSLVMEPDANKSFSFEDATTLFVDNRVAAWHFFSYFLRVFNDKAGTVYLSPIKDYQRCLLEAGENYSITIPKDIPADQFWSMTIYDHATWSFNNKVLG
jgi:hypothetical protein